CSDPITSVARSHSAPLSWRPTLTSDIYTLSLHDALPILKITHVIRGEDHLSNTSKHVELFKAFEAPLPIFAHIPLILKQNGPGKDRKSTRLNSSHVKISYAVFCLKKKRLTARTRAGGRCG